MRKKAFMEKACDVIQNWYNKGYAEGDSDGHQFLKYFLKAMGENETDI